MSNQYQDLYSDGYESSECDCSVRNSGELPQNEPELIETFGSYDYERLLETNPDYVTKISTIPDNLKEIANKLKELISLSKVYIMDKENGVAFPASLVIGYNNNSILIACER